MSQDRIMVFCITREFIQTIDGVLQQEMEVPSRVQIYKVGMHSGILQPMARGLLFFGTLKRVKICIKARTNGNLFRLFFGVIKDLGFDLGLWNWKGQRELMNYNAREGKKLLNPREILSKNVSEKWN